MMKELFEALRTALYRGERAALCCIIASSGSSPRGEGAKMAVFADGRTVGTIGGGAVELQATQRALQAIREKRCEVHSFALMPNEVEDIGMVCGGNVTVSFLLFTPEHLPLLDAILLTLTKNEFSWLITVLHGSGVSEMGVYDNANGLRFTNAVSANDIRPLLTSGGVLQKGEPRIFVEPLTQPGMVYIFGGGHVGQALAPMLHAAGFRVAVYDSRPHAANAEVFPDAERIIYAPYDDIFDRVQLTSADCAVIMTPGHQSDTLLLEQVLRTPAGYVGCIGSRHKIARTRAALLEAGIPETDIKRTHSPIGLDIGGETPAEVAISIAAELIAHRSGQLYRHSWPGRA